MPETVYVGKARLGNPTLLTTTTQLTIVCVFAVQHLVCGSVCTTYLQSTSDTVGQVHGNCAFRPKTNSLGSSPPSLLVVVGEDEPGLWNVTHLAPWTPEGLLLT